MKEEKSGLEEAEKKLYKRGFEELYAPTRTSFYSRDPDVSSEWKGDKENAVPKKTRVLLTMFQKIFFASVAFFALALTAALLLFFSGGNIVSSENVDIKVLGPIAVPGGEELSLQIAVTNNNNISLEYTDLSISYPEGTRSADSSLALPRVRKSLGVVKAGETINEIIRSSLYGKEGTEQSIGIAVEYRVEGSNAIFVKEAKYTVLLSSAPLSVSVDTFSEVNANQEIELRIVVASNAGSPIEDVLLRAQYPFGFEPSDSIPRPRYGTTVWELGTIKPGEVVPILLKGVVRGQDNEQKVFTFTAGRRDDKNEREISAVYSLATAEILVKRPFLSVVGHVAGSSDGRVIVNAGDRIPVEVVWANNLPSRVADVSIEASLEGLGFDKSSVQVTSGAYRSSDNKIIWNGGTLKDLSAVDAGESGVVSFVFIPVVTRGSGAISNPRIIMRINIFGRRVSDTGAMEDISSLSEREIVVNSDLRLSARALYFKGPFQNSGPMPPRVDKKTLYTIVRTITNSSNNMTNTIVRGTLPPYVSWVGRIDPAQAGVSFDEKTGEVVWRLGDVLSGAGFSRGAPAVAFQIVFTPSVSLLGKEPALMTDILFGGMDRFTWDDIQKTHTPVTTNLSSDPSFVSAHGQVVK